MHQLELSTSRRLGKTRTPRVWQVPLRSGTSLQSGRLGVLTCAALLCGLLPAVGTAASATPAPPGPSADGRLFPASKQALGLGWQDSADRTVIGTGDSAGFHVLAADEASSFTYREVADLNEAGLDGIGPWTGYVCTTASGRYAAAVYAPSTATNTPALMQHGAFSAVVNLSTGKVVKTVQGVQLAYFSPACGTGDTVAFTRTTVGDDAAKGTTEVFDVDAATGRTLHTTTVHGQFTNPLPTAGGDVGVVRGRLVRAARDGTLSILASLPGPAFALSPSTAGAVDIATVENGKDVLHRWTGSALTSLGTAPKGSIGLFAQAEGDLVAGDVAGIDTGQAKGLHKIASKHRPVAASRQGHLLVTGVASEELKRTVSKVGASDGQGAGTIRVTGEATATGTPATTYVVTPHTSDVAATTDDTERQVGDGISEMDSMAVGGTPVDDPNPESHYSSCLVKRDSVDAQALQPSPNMVEWAVDQAVHGDLTVSRPANFLATGMPAYTPQGLFPKPALSGGGEVPAQVLLGLLAQESNFKQATWHAVPGDGGNPLLGDYYGNADSIHYYPNYGGSDCGYGISQVTSGMSEIKGTPFTPNKAYALATDYAANIAAGLQILGQTWNQLKGLQMDDNSGNPKYIENWFMALWGYNSGVYTDAAANGGHTGLGWFNNPANPNYPADRSAYLRTSYDDASHPADWPYEEKVMGWAETPQLDAHGNASYSKPSMPSLNFFLNLNDDYFAYCSSANNCTPHQTPDPCPSEDDSCWFRGSVQWMTDSDGTASTENLAYSLGSGEPALQRQYAAPPCNNAPGTLSAIVIDDIPDSDDNVFGCHENPDRYRHGKFTLRLGDNVTSNRDDGTWRATEDIAPIDLHQLSAGYDGHMWFTHDYAAPVHPEDSSSNFLWHQVTATWTPNPEELPVSGQPGEDMDIYIHLPNHGAQAKVLYTVNPGRNNSGGLVHQCPLTQSKYTNGNDVWLELGSVTLWQGANVTANNTYAGGTGDGSLDVAFDAVAFVPVSSHVAGTCDFDS
jgi:hypothetical protein